MGGGGVKKEYWEEKSVRWKLLNPYQTNVKPRLIEVFR